MSVNQPSHFHKWLKESVRQYCLTKPWDITATPVALAISIAKAEGLLREPASGLSLVTPGSLVTIFDMQLKEETTITLVPPSDSDLKNAKISYFSPLGSRLLGCKVGDIIDIKIFSRTETFCVIGIQS
jgi:transcription elongation GreA/GreB family factor